MPAEKVAPIRDRILEGAEAVLGATGAKGLTMGAVGARAGVSRGTLYRNFATKEELLLAVAQLQQETFVAALRAWWQTPPDQPTLTGVIGFVSEWLRTHPALVALIESEGGLAPAPLRQQLPALRELAEELLWPALGPAHAVREGRVSVAELGDLILRIGLSLLVVPDGAAGPGLATIEATLDDFLRLCGEPRPAPAATAKAAPPAPAAPPRRVATPPRAATATGGIGGRFQER